LKNTVRCDL